ncbi:hypothetical protein N7539_006009 [Penicillium diatomitis]|uniref:Oligopeptide transporter n=1 Tax=Penicillium diatomitis TaxID=2819901 RepID=A0A9W9X4P8_9EURO|nr:uncharacterized protein N7539_006009 [Penicillium diatomitis]KAJ5483809.1 hypothetical protein N7539_006009 [Penicillium diatomitis]
MSEGKTQIVLAAEPTENEQSSLRRVSDHIPLATWLIMLFAGVERFSYTAFTAPLQNYIQNPHSEALRPGALGRGQSVAYALNCFLNVLSYLSPLLAATFADGSIGQFWTISCSAAVYVAGLLVVFITSVPSLSGHDAGLAGLICALVLVGVGIGGIKSSVSPMMVDQLHESVTRTAKTKDGETVIIDREMTIRRVYSFYYWVINLGGLLGMLTTVIEKKYGFWAAFLLPLCTLSTGLGGFILGRKFYVQPRREKGMVPKLFLALWLAIRGKCKLDDARASHQLSAHGRVVHWDDEFIANIRKAVHACRVALVYPIVWLCFSQNQTNLVSQAADMKTYGIPNDILAMLNPIFVLVTVPVLNKVVYPLMSRIGCPLRPTARMAIGFFITAASMAVAAGVEEMVYRAPPCYRHPQKCPAVVADAQPNDVSVALQVPVYFLGAVGEVFFSVSGSEFAYNQAPAGMKSIVQAIFASTNAGSAVLGLALSPAARDPNMVIMFATFAGVMFAASVIFTAFFWKVG